MNQNFPAKWNSFCLAIRETRDLVYMVGLEGSSLLRAPSGKPSRSNEYCSQLDQLKAALEEKHPELVNRKRMILPQDNARPHVSLMTRQKLLLQLGW